jgi:ribosomal protein L15
MNAKEEAVRFSVREMYKRIPKKGFDCPSCMQTWKNELGMNLAALKTKKQTKETTKRINEIQEKLGSLDVEDKKQEDYLAKVNCKAKKQKKLIKKQ